MVSSKQHWDDLNRAHADQLSPNAASREVPSIQNDEGEGKTDKVLQMFQSKQAFGFDWPDARQHVSVAGVRSIKNMTQRLPGLQSRFVEILDQEFDKVVAKGLREDGRSAVCTAVLAIIGLRLIGWARLPLYETVQRVLLRINVLWFFGEDTGMLTC